MLVSYIKKIRDRYAPVQLVAFFNWCKYHPDAQLRPIYVDLSSVSFYCDYKRSFHVPTSDVQFIVTSPNKFDTCLADVGISERKHWKNIFSSAVTEVWENALVHKTTPLPLRFGLSTEEKNNISRITRTYLGYLLDPIPNVSNQAPIILPDRFLLPTDLDIALWVNGELRGSIVLEATPLINGFKQATLLACNDARFKPVTFEELPQTAIEFSIISSLRVPITKAELIKNHIYPDKTYRVKTVTGVGWYVPAVFNCIHLSGLQELFSTLSREKVPNYQTNTAYLFDISETESFIDTASETGKPYDLHGPILQKRPTTLPVTSLFTSMQQKAATHLIHNQEVDGNIIAVIDPLHDQERKIDWVRLACTSLALTKYAKHNSHTESKHAAQLAYFYVQKHLLKHRTLDPYTKCLASLYLYQTAAEIADTETMTKSLKIITESMPKVPYEPILYLQRAKLSTALGETHQQNYSELVWGDFLQKIQSNTTIDLASYAGLLETTGPTTDTTALQTTYDWYLQQQQPNGAFPAQSNHPGFHYVRGTAKIVECLCAIPGYRESMSFKKAIEWLHTMQYDTTNTYFIRNHRQALVVGGFRHDATNASVWIDSSAHALLIK